jgi:hypothetical protein
MYLNFTGRWPPHEPLICSVADLADHIQITGVHARSAPLSGGSIFFEIEYAPID